MLQKHKEGQIDPATPWKDDQLERRGIAEQFTRILETVDGPLVASVSAPFGMGKTYFAKRWVADLNRQGKIAIYFNAWETDYADNPFVAFMHALRSSVAELDLPSTKKAAATKRLKSVVRAGAPVLMKSAAKAVLRAGGYILIGGNVDNIGEAAVKGSIENIEKFAEAQIEAFSVERLSRIEFREELSKLRNSIFHNQDQTCDRNQNSDEKIYLIVDELDRCRPPYALELLEEIKHLFDVMGFVFVIFVDDDQLSSSASKLYGAKTDGENYARKFLDFRFSLPIPNYGVTSRFLYKKFAIDDILKTEGDDTIFGRPALVETFCYFSCKFDLSLREQIQAFSLVDLVLRAYGRTYLFVLAALVCLREGRPAIWKQFISGNCTYDRVAEELGFDSEMTREKGEEVWYLHAMIRMFFVERPLEICDNMSEVDDYAIALNKHLRLNYRNSLRFDKVNAIRSKIELIENIKS